MEKPGFEYKHVKCAEDLVNLVIQQHQLFYWEIIETQTVVAKESHLDRPELSNVIYSVTTEERFVTLLFKRNKNIPHYEKIKAIETKYFTIVQQQMELLAQIPQQSPVFQEVMKGLKERGPVTAARILYARLSLPGLILGRIRRADAERKLEKYAQLQDELDHLVEANKDILNI